MKVLNVLKSKIGPWQIYVILSHPRVLLLDITPRLRLEDIKVETTSTPILKLYYTKLSKPVQAKKHLSVGYGRFPGYEIENLTAEKIKKKISLCQEVLATITILEPGISTQRGYFDRIIYR